LSCKTLPRAKRKKAKVELHPVLRRPTIHSSKDVRRTDEKIKQGNIWKGISKETIFEDLLK